MIIYLRMNQSKRPPIPTSSSSSLGGGGGTSFFASGFLPALSSFFSAGVAVGTTVAGSPAADELAAEPPKLKKLAISFPLSALANSLGQYASIFTPDALIILLIFSPE